MGASGPNMRDISGEVGEYGNTSGFDLRNMNMDNPYKEIGPMINFKDAPVTLGETLKGYRMDNPRVGLIDMWKNQGGDETTAFNFPGITSLKNMFQRPEAKQKEFDMYQQSKGPGGWGDIGGGYQGNIWGGNKLNVYDPASGQMVLRDKNFDSMFGSESVEEMLGKKEAWARKRRTKGEDYLSEALKGWLDELDRKKGGADGPQKGPTTDRAKIEAYTGRPMSDYRAGRPPSERGFTGHGTSGMGRDPDTWKAQGGYMRSGYNRGGRVGILAAF